MTASENPNNSHIVNIDGYKANNDSNLKNETLDCSLEDPAGIHASACVCYFSSMRVCPSVRIWNTAMVMYMNINKASVILL